MTDIVAVADEPCHHVVYENPHVRVFYVEVPPHQSTRVHRHDRPYSVTIVGRAEIEDHPVDEDPAHKHYDGGEASSGHAGFTHRVVNLGDRPFINVVVEIK